MLVYVLLYFTIVLGYVYAKHTHVCDFGGNSDIL